MIFSKKIINVNFANGGDLGVYMHLTVTVLMKECYIIVRG